MLAREYGLEIYAVDDPEENKAFFRDMGVADDVIHPVHADASEGLPFLAPFFGAAASIDSYNFEPLANGP